MTAEAATERSPGGVRHVGVLAERGEAPVALLAPLVTEALDAGAAVDVVVGDTGARGLRARFAGRDPSPTFATPGRESAGALVHRLRTRAEAADAPALVVIRECRDDSPDDLVLAEGAVDLLLPPEHAVTVVCVHDASDAAAAARAVRTHPWLLAEHGGLQANPAYRAPPTSNPVPDTVLGTAVVSVAVATGSALGVLRRQVAAAARDAGLHDDRLDATVLAAHEAMLLASGARAYEELRPGHHTATVRLREHDLVVDCRGAPDGRGAGEPDDDPRLGHLRHFADEVIVHEPREGRVVRMRWELPRNRGPG